MKKLVLFLIMLMTVGYSQAQTIGNTLNELQELNPGGDFETSSKPYTYSVVKEDVKTLIIYFLDDNLICYQIVIFPQDDDTRQNWIKSFNNNWIKLSPTSWRYYRDDGTVLFNFIDYIEDAGLVFVIKEKKNFN